jgi:hypothetical protein
MPGGVSQWNDYSHASPPISHLKMRPLYFKHMAFGKIEEPPSVVDVKRLILWDFAQAKLTPCPIFTIIRHPSLGRGLNPDKRVLWPLFVPGFTGAP